MIKADIERLAENYALATFLSDSDGYNYDEIIEAFNGNEIPSDVVIWYPFEDFDLVFLAESIENLRNDYLNFADTILGA